MVNQKGEFPTDARISARVKGSTKRLLKRLKEKGHTEASVVEYAARLLAEEPVLLEWEIGEIDLKLAELDSEKYSLESEKQAKLNRLRMIAPKRLDEDTLYNMMKSHAKDYVVDSINRANRFGKSINAGDFKKSSAFSSMRSYGEDLGYDPSKFADEVVVQAEILLSDNVV